MQIGILLCVLVALIFAINSTSNRRLKELHYSVIQLYITIAGLLVSSVWLAFDQRNREAFSFDAKILLEILGSSACSFLAQMITTCVY